MRAFVEASAVGWRDYLHGDPRPADALILKANPEMTEDVLAQARDKMRTQYGLVDVGATRSHARRRRDDRQPLGRLLQDRLAGERPANYKDAFTLQFLPNPPVK